MSVNPFENPPASRPSENLLKAISRVKELTGGKKKVDPETRKMLVMDVFDNLRREMLQLGTEYTSDINQLVSQSEGTYIVRREDPERLMHLVRDQQEIQLSVDPKVGELYANSVEWNKQDGPRGLDVAFQEGQGDISGIAMVAGYRPTHLTVQGVPNSIRPGQGIDRSLVRCSTGTLMPEDVRFIITRIAAQFMPEEELTEKELERLEEKTPEEAKRMSIFRGFIIPEKHAEYIQAAAAE